jgi:hypothetical protein
LPELFKQLALPQELCGHATLAAAHIIFNKIQPELQQIDFYGRTVVVSAKHENDLIF